MPDTKDLIAKLRLDAGDYAIAVLGDALDRTLSWDQREVRAWQAADALEVFEREREASVKDPQTLGQDHPNCPPVTRPLPDRAQLADIIAQFWASTDTPLDAADAVLAAIEKGGE